MGSKPGSGSFERAIFWVPHGPEWQETSCQAPGFLGPIFGELRVDITCAHRTEVSVSGRAPRKEQEAWQGGPAAVPELLVP